MKPFLNSIVGVMLLVSPFLNACSDSDQNSAGAPMRSYEMTVTNLTNNQPFSPIAAVLHTPDFSGMTLGTSASAALEVLAEGGDNSQFLSDADVSPFVGAAVSGTGVIPPGMQETIMLSGMGTQLTLAGMLVNTNDTIIAVNGMALEMLVLNETQSFLARAYDTGTEGNSEAAADVPGPVGGGEGFNAARDDRDFIIAHPGILSADGGLSGSALDESHRFDNPVARIVVKRIL